MRVNVHEVGHCLDFDKNEKGIMRPALLYSDAFEQLTFAIEQFGSKRVTDLVIAAKNAKIAWLTLREVPGISDVDARRLKDMLTPTRVV
jgi:hypothetical protein